MPPSSWTNVHSERAGLPLARMGCRRPTGTSVAQVLEPRFELSVPGRAPTKSVRSIPSPPTSVCGAVFPSGDGDDYLSLCLKAKPDHATEIRRLFEQDPSPSFALIDNVGGGLQWPTLRTLLQAESARDILFALLVPSPKQGKPSRPTRPG